MKSLETRDKCFDNDLSAITRFFPQPSNVINLGLKHLHTKAAGRKPDREELAELEL